jgi:transposase-like protein
MGRDFTADERARAVKAYHSRGSRSIKDVAADFGVSRPVLSYWVKQHAEGTLDVDEPASKPGALARRTIETRESFVVDTRPASTSLSEHEELVLLRREVRRLKRALAAYAELDEE